MDPSDLEVAFREFAARDAIDLEATTPSVGVPAMLRFYSDTRPDRVGETAHGDMLLFQWGTYDWGAGEHFEVDITRQVILPEEVDDDAIWQLHVTYRFTPSEELRSLGSGTRWCDSRAELEEFGAFVRGTPAFGAVADRKPRSVVVEYECAG